MHLSPVPCHPSQEQGQDEHRPLRMAHRFPILVRAWFVGNLAPSMVPLGPGSRRGRVRRGEIDYPYGWGTLSRPASPALLGNRFAATEHPSERNRFQRGIASKKLTNEPDGLGYQRADSVKV